MLLSCDWCCLQHCLFHCVPQGHLCTEVWERLRTCFPFCSSAPVIAITSLLASPGSGGPFPKQIFRAWVLGVYVGIKTSCWGLRTPGLVLILDLPDLQNCGYRSFSSFTSMKKSHLEWMWKEQGLLTHLHLFIVSFTQIFLAPQCFVYSGHSIFAKLSIKCFLYIK